MHTFYSNWRPVSNSHISFPLPGVINDTKKYSNHISHVRKLPGPGLLCSPIRATNDGDSRVGKLSPRRKQFLPIPRIIAGNRGQMYFLSQEYDEWKFKL